MTSKKNTARVAVKAAACVDTKLDTARLDTSEQNSAHDRSTTKKVQWLACVELSAEPQPDGISSRYERLPGVFRTSDQAMDAAELAVSFYPGALGYAAVRVGGAA